MEGTAVLILLALVMFVGSYFVGSIPLFMPMSEEKLQLVSVLGAGLLVGTALAVIIPEGVRSLDSAVDVHSKIMYLFSYTADHATPSSTKHPDDIYIRLYNFIKNIQCPVIPDPEGGTRSERNITATVGLVVHAAAAFGLVTFLLHEGLDRNRIKRHLIVFSLSAPLLALLTYFGIGQEGKETLSSVNATGIAMLFSAGTFLYVATVHVLPELTSRGGHSHGGALIETSDKKGLRTIELAFLIVGALLPLFLTMGHHH
ncbi:Zinc transporter ZIP9-B [Blattella germanica]|nr:Zinc transporter ZIP9-B [Blattella germanica]